MKPKEFSSTFKEVFSKPRYVLLTFLIAFIFYLGNVLITNYQNIGTIYSLNGFLGVLNLMPTLFLGLERLLPRSSFIVLILISVMVGALFSLISYRTKMLKNFSNEGGFFATSGIFLGVLAPGCAACGLGILPLLGLSSAALTYLPYDGLELSILAIGILSFSIFKITKDINKGISCEIPMAKSKDVRKPKSDIFREMKGGQNE